MKTCTKCKNSYPETNEYFHKRKNGKNGLNSMCKKCNNEIKNKWAKDNKEKVKQSKSKWREENKSYLNEKNKEYYQENIEAIKEYRRLNKEKKNEADRLYRKNNKDKIKKYLEKNKEHIKERNRIYRKENREIINIQKQIRRARLNKSKADLTIDEWEQIKGDFGYKCAYCGMTEKEHIKKFNEQLHQEHFIPLSEGGEYTRNNIIPACKSCNSRKYNKNYFDWYKECEFYDKERNDFILKYLGYEKEC